jgi:hypothetical protein
MMVLATTIFAEKLETDPRDPLLFFSIPFVGSFGFMGIVSQFWMQMVALGVMHMFIGLIAAFLAYECILGKKRSAMAILVGYGVICPLVLYVPYRLIEEFDLRNPVFKLAAVASPALLIFRCFETMYGTLPSFATKSYNTFLWYFAATVEFNVHAETQELIPTTYKEIRQKSLCLVILFIQSAALFTILVPFDYNIFPRREIATFFDMFYWGNLFNTYLMGALTKTTFEFGLSLLGLVVSCWSGYSTASINVRPLTATSSPSDFWGRRWNTLVSGGLKRGIYKPFRKQGFSRPVAALVTFMASGLLHEYFMAAMAFGGSSSDEQTFNEAHVIGGHLAFFLWNAIVLIMDGLFKRTALIRFMEESLPKPARTALVLMTVLPIAHVFTDQFVSIGFYSGFSLGYPRIILINAPTLVS